MILMAIQSYPKTKFIDLQSELSVGLFLGMKQVRIARQLNQLRRKRRSFRALYGKISIDAMDFSLADADE